jgi:hypothetical protein
MPLSVTGNNGDFCSSTIFTGAGWTSLAQNTYWIKYIGDTKVVQVYHAAGADNVGRITGCNECPTPSPTTAPTTSSPTTAPTTAAPTTASPTTAPTTAAPTTPNPTTPPTPAPTSPFGGTIEYSSISAADVCNNGSTPLVVTGNNGTFCTSTIFTGAGWPSLPTGNYWIKWIGDTKVVQVFHASNADNVGRITGCNECPTPSPTNAPTTASPTTPPTPPPTTPPTPPPTPPPTTPPTPAPTESAPPFSFLVNNIGRTVAEIACSIAKTRTLYSYDSDFSIAERFYSTNTYPYTPFDGLDRYFSDGTYSVKINTSGYSIDMVVCPTPSPTTAPTTASPTTPPTPPPTPPPTTPPTPPPTPPPTTPPTPPPTTPPTPPPTPPPTTPPTPPPTAPPTPPPTPHPTLPTYYYYDLNTCFVASDVIGRSLTSDLSGVWNEYGTCYVIYGVTFQQGYTVDLDNATYQGGSCYVAGCGYTPPPPPPPTTNYTCDFFEGCIIDDFGIYNSLGACLPNCYQP